MPPHTEKEFKELKEDIRKNKLQIPITTYEGKILDGRGRYNACVELAKEGVETNFRTDPYAGPDPRRYVVSANVKRRHFNKLTEPKTHRGNPAGVAQQGMATHFKKEPITQGKGYEPKAMPATGVPGYFNSAKAGPGSERTIMRSGSQSQYGKPVPDPAGPPRDILSQFGPEATGKR
jgi:hypothetical protein